ncbi:MAG: M61 family metallopeptidase [Thermoplasmata archaeon]
MVLYQVDLSDSHEGIVHVTMEFSSRGREEVVMPVWTPGSYSVRDFSRHLFGFKSSCDSEQLSKNRWALMGQGRVSVEYYVYCDELSVQTSYANGDFALLNGAGIFLYVEGRKGEECEVRLENLGAKGVATGLDEESEMFIAEDYDQLVDSPFLIGNFESMKFEVMGKEHLIAWQGLIPVDREGIVRDFRKIVEEEGKIFGELPYKRYVFIIIALPDEIYGGLEHKNSTAIMTDGRKLADPTSYKLFLSIVSHEFFHTWNVKRIRPRELGPFDYTKEVHTNLLWLSEGFTSYYEWLVLWRAGIVTEEEYFKHLAVMIQYYLLQPGHTYPADLSSFNTWIKLYKPDGNILNSYVSYYLKGELIAFALNCFLLKETEGKKSLDDLFRLLYSDFKTSGEGIEKGKLIFHIEGLAGSRGGELVREMTEEEGEIDFDYYLSTIGYSIERRRRGEKPLGFLGLVLSGNGGKLIVKSSLKGYPAFEAGVLSGDEVVAVNNQRFTDFFTRELSPEIRNFRIDDMKWIRPGERVTLHLFRNNRLLSFEMKAGEEPPEVSLRRKEESRLKEKMLAG